MKLQDLIDKCDRLQLNPVPTRQRRNPDRFELSVNDCLKVLRKYYISEMKREGTYTEAIDYMLGIESPMLALNFTKVDSKIQEELWNENNLDWIFEEKINGTRAMLIHIDGEISILGRECSDINHLPRDYTKKITYAINAVELQKLPNFMLDCELSFQYKDSMLDKNPTYMLETMSTVEALRIQQTNKINITVFDCIMYEDNYLYNNELRERRNLAKDIVNKISLNVLNNTINFIQYREGIDKKSFYDRIKIEQGEGIVAKDLTSTYNIYGKRTGAWVKLKNDPYSSLVATEDTLDVFVTEVESSFNFIDSFSIGAYLTDDHDEYLYDTVLDKNSIMPAPNNGSNLATNFVYTRKELKMVSLGKVPCHNPNLMNLILTELQKGNRPVLSIKYDAIDQINFMLVNPIIYGMRQDRTDLTCTIRASEILGHY